MCVGGSPRSPLRNPGGREQSGLQATRGSEQEPGALGKAQVAGGGRARGARHRRLWGWGLGPGEAGEEPLARDGPGTCQGPRTGADGPRWGGCRRSVVAGEAELTWVPLLGRGLACPDCKSPEAYLSRSGTASTRWSTDNTHAWSQVLLLPRPLSVACVLRGSVHHLLQDHLQVVSFRDAGVRTPRAFSCLDRPTSPHPCSQAVAWSTSLGACSPLPAAWGLPCTIQQPLSTCGVVEFKFKSVKNSKKSKPTSSWHRPHFTCSTAPVAGTCRGRGVGLLRPPGSSTTQREKRA